MDLATAISLEDDTSGSDWVPAYSQDLIVVPLAGDLEHFLSSFQPFSYFVTFAVKFSRLLVVLHSCRCEKR